MRARAQAELLSKKLGIPQLSAGEMFRSARPEGSELGQRVVSIMDAGKLVSMTLSLHWLSSGWSRPGSQMV